jgi:hypothetical protein
MYRINGSVQVATIELHNKLVYVIFGQKTERNLPNYKTCIPDIFHKKTLLPVPDKVLMQGVDKVAFTKEVRETLLEKREYYKKLFEKYENISNKDLFLSTDLSKEDKIFVARLKNNEQYSLLNAIKYVTEKHSRSRFFQGNASSESDTAN